MNQSLALLATAGLLAVSAHAFKLEVNECTDVRLDFALTELDNPSGTPFWSSQFLLENDPLQLGPVTAYGSLSVIPGAGGYTILMEWAGITDPDGFTYPTFFTVTAPFGPDNVANANATQILLVPNGLRLVFGEPVEIEEEVQDTDGDGVADEVDGCPQSVQTPTLVIGGCDTGVANPVGAGGCTLADQVLPVLSQAAAGARNRGALVSTMAHYLNSLVAAGTLTVTEKEAIMPCVAAAAKRR